MKRYDLLIGHMIVYTGMLIIGLVLGIIVYSCTQNRELASLSYVLGILLGHKIIDMLNNKFSKYRG